jgi:SAM-dependent methyltransferase
MDPKTMWEAGNLAAVAERITEVGELVVQRAGVEPGMDVLDVACGTGNATLPAAKAGARVTGMARAIAELVPPPPGAVPPNLWGSEDHVRELLGDAEFERREVEWTDESPESYARFMLENFGPLLNAREALAGREHELDEAFTDFLRSENLADDGTLRLRGEYLLSIVRP